MTSRVDRAEGWEPCTGREGILSASRDVHDAADTAVWVRCQVTGGSVDTGVRWPRIMSAGLFHMLTGPFRVASCSACGAEHRWTEILDVIEPDPFADSRDGGDR